MPTICEDNNEEDVGIGVFDHIEVDNMKDGVIGDA